MEHAAQTGRALPAEGTQLRGAIWAGESCVSRPGGQGGALSAEGEGGVALPMQGHLSFCITDWRDASIRICFSLYLRCPERGYLELLIGATSNGYLQVSILFCDIVSYTNMSSEMTPDHVVNLLNNVYTYVRGGKKHVEGQGQRLGEAAP